MSHPDREESAAEDENPTDPDGGSEASEADWTPPERSDQTPGEEVVQVNDAYRGGGPPPEDEAHQDDEQHPTGG